jgi:hypothetical protein
MDIQSIILQLKDELAKIDRAIEALIGVGSQPARRGRPPKSSGQRHMSPAARARISAAMKKRWALRKGKAAPQKAAAKKATASAEKGAPKRKPMSAAARKRLSEQMKTRWAAKKKTP